MSTGRGEPGEALTLATLRLQRRFVPDKKADIEQRRKTRRIPGIFASVAEPTQSWQGQWQTRLPPARTKRGSGVGSTWPPTVSDVHLYLLVRTRSIKAVRCHVARTIRKLIERIPVFRLPGMFDPNAVK
jgi:hypothetical protein